MKYPRYLKNELKTMLFDKYTDSARRVIFHSRRAASKNNSTEITKQDFMEGLVVELCRLANIDEVYLTSNETTSKDMPLSEYVKDVLNNVKKREGYNTDVCDLVQTIFEKIN